MTDQHCKSAVSQSYAGEGLGNNPGINQRVQKEFRSAGVIGDALLETAIAVAAVDAGYTDDYEAFAWLACLRSQRTSPPSTSLGQAQATGECRGDAAGGGL